MKLAEKTIPDNFFALARTYPDRILFHYFFEEWKTVAYAPFAESVTAASAFLRKTISPGDRVAIIAENSPWWCSAYLSILTAGGIAVPVDAQLGAEEIRNLLADSGAKIVFYSEMTERSVKSGAEGLATDSVMLIRLDGQEFRSFSKGDQDSDILELSPDEVASIIYTSGTTGNPKGVMLSHRNFCSDAEALISAGLVNQDDNVLAVLPLHHTYAFMCTFLVPAFLGAAITFPVSLKGPDLLVAIKDRGVSILIGVPQLLNLLRNSIMNKIRSLPAPFAYIMLKLHHFSGFCREKLDVNIGHIIFRSVHKLFGDQFRFIGSGGAKLDTAIIRDLEALGFTVLEGYGLTETSPVLIFNPPGARKRGSVGKPLPSVELRIAARPETGEGEIEVKGPMVMKGYYRNKTATDEVLREGWFRTGDLGRIDKGGYLFITGRSKEVIVLDSGKNVYPEDLERIYEASPLITEICVLGIARAHTISLHAVIVPDFDYARKTGISDIGDAIKWEMNRLSIKVPSSMRITGFSISKEPLPRTPLGKLRRFMIQEKLGSISPEKKDEREEIEEDETVAAVFRILRQFTPEGKKISPADHLELDLGLDSLSKLELAANLEKTLSMKLPANFLADLRTVADMINEIRKHATGDLIETEGKTSWKQILGAEPREEIDFAKNSSIFPVFLLHSLLKCSFKLFFRLEARGVQNLPLETNFILAPNHTSYLDGFVLLLSLPFSCFTKIYSLGLSNYFSGRFKGWFARMAHVIPIDSAFYLDRALLTSAYILKSGYSLSVFPEGGRSFDGELMEFKKGVGILAVETRVAVIPVSIKGAFDALPRTAFWPRPVKITVTFGEPLYASQIDFSRRPAEMDDYQYFADLLRKKVKEL